MSDVFEIMALVTIFLTVCLVFAIRDIRDRRRVINEIGTRADKHKKLLDEIPGGIGVFRLKNGNVICDYINDGFRAMLGLEKEIDKYYKQALELVHPDDRGIVIGALVDAEKFGGIADCEIRIIVSIAEMEKEEAERSYGWVNLRGKIVSSDTEESAEDDICFYVSFTEVNDRVENKRMLEESNRKLVEVESTLAAAVESSNLFYWEYYPELNLSIQGDSTMKGAGVSKRFEDYPESWIKCGFVHPDYVDEYRRIHKELADGLDEAEFDVIERNNLQDYHWERITYKSIYDEKGNRIKIIGSCKDITTQKSLELHFERYMDAILLMNPDALCSCRMNLTTGWVGDGRFMNVALEDLFKIDNTDEFFESAVMFTVPEERKDYRKCFNVSRLIRAYDSGESEVSLEHRIELIEGVRTWVRTIMSIAKNPSNGDIEAVLLTVNINDSKISSSIIEDAIVHDYDELDYLDLNTGRYTIFRNGSITLRNNLFEDVKNPSFSKKWINMEELSAIMDMLDRDYIKRRLDTEHVFYFYYSVADGDSYKRKKLRFSYADEYDGKVLISKSDITDFYKREQEKNTKLEVALTEAREANSAKSDFLSRMSHDIRTPMNGVIGMTRLALDEENPDNVRDYLVKINASANFLLGLINDVLDMSKIESGQITLKPEKYPYKEFYNYLNAVFAPQCKMKNVEFIVSKEDAYKGLYVDKLRFNQIFFNLVSNAVKFTKPGGKVEVKFTDLNQSAADRVSFTVLVSDTGIGISQEFLDHIFDPFSQEHNDNSDSVGRGTGLGLSIVKNLVEMFDGSISVNSKLGEGTTFVVRMSAQFYDLSDEDEELYDSYVQGGDRLDGRRVLLCEDNEINAEIAVMTLEKKGIITEWAENGRVGVERYAASAECPYDAILMDIRMPELGGLEATRAIRAMELEDSKTIPIIAMTANAFTDDIERSREAGMNAHLSKPFDPQLLYDTLEKYIFASKR